MATLVRPVPKKHLAAGEEHLVPVYVWELPVRLSHWGIVAAVTVLTWTGLYMNHPFLIFPGPRQWTMGTVRFIHELAGFELIGALLVRIYWFFAGNHWARWRQFIPLTQRQWKSLKAMFRYYTFQQRKPFEQIGHNTLAGLTYIVVYFLIACECITGLVLFATVEGSPTLRFFVGWIPQRHRHPVDPLRALPLPVLPDGLFHPPRLQRRAGSHDGAQCRDGKYLQRLQICG